MRKLLTLAHCVLFFTACSLTTSSSEHEAARQSNQSPQLVLHGAGGGYWQPNSRNAVTSSVEAFSKSAFSEQIYSIEVDIVLTKDQQLVLSHDPWVNKELCLTLDGEHPGHTLIKDLTLRELQQRYLCGHRNLKEFPGAEVKSESMMSVHEMLDSVANAPELAIYFDVKIQQDVTADEISYARAIEETLDRFSLDNKIYIEGPTIEALQAYRNYINHPYQSILSYPPFYAGENWTLVGALALIRAYFDAEFPVEQAQKVAADFIASPIQVLNDTAIESLQNLNIGLILYTANDRKSFDQACELEPDFIISDYPELAPC